MLNIFFRYCLYISCLFSLNAAAIVPLATSLNVAINIEANQARENEQASSPALYNKNRDYHLAVLTKLIWLAENSYSVDLLLQISDTCLRDYCYHQKLANEFAANFRVKQLAFLAFSSEPS